MHVRTHNYTIYGICAVAFVTLPTYALEQYVVFLVTVKRYLKLSPLTLNCSLTVPSKYVLQCGLELHSCCYSLFLPTSKKNDYQMRIKEGEHTMNF